jgi:hypothetical protein
MRVAVFCALIWQLGGCKPDCAAGPDIQVSIVAEPGLSTRNIAALYLLMSIDGGPMKTTEIMLTRQLGASDAFLLHPDTNEPSKYNIALQIHALDSGGRILAFGSAAGDVTTSGCNRLEALLSTLPGGLGGTDDLGVDMAVPTDDSGTPQDFAGVDLTGVDLAPICQVGANAAEQIDEDQDGRANTCDICAADADQSPVDTDGDGLPDACDPDPMMVTNRPLYFAPFNADDGHWVGGYPINNSFMLMDSGQGVADGARVVYSTNSTDVLEAGVRVQTVVYVPSPCCYQGPLFPDTGIYLGSASDPTAATANGMVCVITYHLGQGSDTLDLYPIVNGVIGASSSAQTSLGLKTFYRIRLTQRKMGTTAANYTCEALELAPGRSPVSVTLTGSAATTTQYMALRANSIETHPHSVVAQSTLP